jgi:hypothetical protein
MHHLFILHHRLQLLLKWKSLCQVACGRRVQGRLHRGFGIPGDNPRRSAEVRIPSPLADLTSPAVLGTSSRTGNLDTSAYLPWSSHDHLSKELTALGLLVGLTYRAQGDRV